MSEKYTIISGTNRAGSKTLQVARLYRQMLRDKGIDAQLVSLEDWQSFHRTPAFEQLEKEVLIPTQKFIFISPEYNGSIPGVLKVMFDISGYKEVWAGKKALLSGVSRGRAGNLRGMEHLTGILHYLRVIVHPNKLPISMVDHLFNGSETMEDEATLKAISHQLDEFIEF